MKSKKRMVIVEPIYRINDHTVWRPWVLLRTLGFVALALLFLYGMSIDKVSMHRGNVPLTYRIEK